MSRSRGATLSHSLKIAVFVVFALLTVAVIASEARSSEPLTPAAAATTPTTPLLQQSLLASRIGRLGSSVARAWSLR
ncbi:MAG: hypothetical protein HKN35_12620 [Woeseia sp.]|nr:hypothetical protein [Woeseia sp.]MBT8095819.1 hypothetical protein [Woeseia sp.]NNE61731.1 hypothetical protein [Woeseia sp.]NNL55073.1 hypothetical protein [Woeseia sp.]